MVHVNPATKESTTSFHTFQKARDAIRTIRQKDPGKRKETFTIIVAPGTYLFTQTFELGPKEFNTIWKAEKPNTVFLTGGPSFSAQSATLLTDSEKARIITKETADNILRIDLKKAGVQIDLGKIQQRGFAKPYRPMQSELFIDGKAQHLSQWPNKGGKHIRIGKVIDKGSIPRNKDWSNRGATFQFAPDRIKQWKGAPEAWISGYFAWGYSDDCVKIDTINSDKKTIKTVQPSRYGFMSGKGFRAFYGFNMLEEIDQPGEYYIDRKAAVLYFYPPENFKKATSTLTLSSLRTPMVSMVKTKNITLQGFTFENTCGMGVYMDDTTRCIVDQCTLRNIGLVAVVIGNGVEPSVGQLNEFDDSILTRKPTVGILGSINERIYSDTTFERRGGKENAITNSHIYAIGCGGIHIGGGSFKTLTPSKNRVENCHIHHVNRIEKSYRTAVNLDGVGQIIRHNLIEDTQQTAIYFHGNDHLIEYNKFIRCMSFGDDQGVIYYGRNQTELGNTVRYNYFQDCARGSHCSRSSVIYADDGACNMITYGNIFVRSGSGYIYLLGGGSHHKNHDNVFVDCGNVIHMDNRLQGWGRGQLKKGGIMETRLKAIESISPNFYKRYPFLKDYFKKNPAKPQHNTFQRSIFFNCKVGQRKNISVTNEYVTQTNPGFKNPSKNDWTLTPSLEALKALGKDFKTPPFEQMGIQK